MNKRLAATFTTAALLAVGSAHAQLLDDHFDDGNIATGGVNGGFQLTDNAFNSPGSSIGESGTIGTVTTGGANNNAGLYSINSVDLVSGDTAGFSATFVVDSAPSAYFNNGLMLGIIEDIGGCLVYRYGNSVSFRVSCKATMNGNSFRFH